MRRQLALAGGLSAAATLAANGAADAATIQVTNTNGDASAGSLFDAVGQSEANPGADTITFASGLSGTVTLEQALPTITQPLDIVGPGAGQLAVSGNDAYRAFTIDGSAGGTPVAVGGLTVEHGYFKGEDGGGGIFAQDAALTISDSVLRQNEAVAPYSSVAFEQTRGAGVAGDGSGSSLSITSSTITGNIMSCIPPAFYGCLVSGMAVFERGELRISNSTVSGHSGPGGAIFQRGPATIERSTISGNDFSDVTAAVTLLTGQGGQGAPDPVLIENSTISGNHGPSRPAEHRFVPGTGVLVAGIYDANEFSVTIRDSTITGNDPGGLGYVNIPQSVTIENSIVAGNTLDSAAQDMGGPFSSAFSLFGSLANATNTETVPGSDIIGADPQLGPLQDNGGPTETMAPAPGSPAVDAGSAFGLASDQRGSARPVNVSCAPDSTASGADGADIGAVELAEAAGCPPPGGGGGQAGGAQPGAGRAGGRCKRLLAKLKRQKHRRRRAGTVRKRRAIKRNLADSRSRLRRHHCRG